MTHYPVFVICKPGQNPEELLAPYEEYGSRLEITKYTAWQDETDEVMKDWEDGTTEVIVMPDGTFKYPWDDVFQVPGRFGWSSDGTTHKVPDNLERRSVTFKEMYGTLERFAYEYSGHTPIPDQPGRFGYLHNPRGYWDWYTLGGRWRGAFSAGDIFNPESWNGKAPQAVVTPDGEWHARGQVGWFGYRGGEEKQDEWEAQVRACIEAHPEHLIHNYDLHT